MPRQPATGMTAAVIEYITQNQGCVMREISQHFNDPRKPKKMLALLVQSGRVVWAGEGHDRRYYTDQAMRDEAQRTLPEWLAAYKAARVAYVAAQHAKSTGWDQKSEDERRAIYRARRAKYDKARVELRRKKRAEERAARGLPPKLVKEVKPGRKPARARKEPKPFRTPEGAPAVSTLKPIQLKPDWRDMPADTSRARITVCPPVPDRWAVQLPADGGVITQDWKERRAA